MHDPACCPLLLEAQRQWEVERTQMREQIERQCVDAKGLKRRFKMLQTTLEEQQKVLDRYQKMISEHGLLVPVAGDAVNEPKADELQAIPSDTHSPTRKRLKVAAPPESKRTSLPVATKTKPASLERKTSPDRRRSLPEMQQERIERHATNKASFDSWRARKKDMHGAIRATDFLTRRVENGARSARQQDDQEDSRSTSTDSFLEDGKLSPKQKRVKSEPAEMRSPPRSLFAAQKRSLPKHAVSSTSSAVAKPASSSNGHAPERPNGYAYVEVVRNRQERAALPGHDCIECRKYYEALDGLVPESEMKAMCSRHRARFEPYQTPDDFWRLSFPDSPSQDLASP